MKKCKKARWVVLDWFQQTQMLKTQILRYCKMRWLYSVFLFSLFFILFFDGVNNCYSAAPDTFELLLPGNIPLSFKAIYLGIDGEKIFASKRIKLGPLNQDGSYKGQRIDTLLAGSFTGNRNGRTDWLYYLSKTEIEQCQWNAVMRWWEEKNGSPVEPINTSKLPQTGKTLSEIYTFIEALNTWMMKSAKDTLPSYKNAKAFCRLPTEAEWEFAARGGIMVPQDVFDRPYPYQDENGGPQLEGFEWYRSNSGNKVRECGSSYLKPNPVGLYDMLGNAEELTMSLFGPEYQQGRFGNLVIRGSNFSSDQKDLTASARTEYLSHTSEGELLRQEKVGIRLALSTRITSSGYLSEELDKGYDIYTKAQGLTHPGPSGKSSPTNQATEDFIQRYSEEKQRLQGVNDNLLQKLESREEELKRIQIDLAQKDHRLNDMDTELHRKDQQLETLKNQSASTEESKKVKNELENKSSEISQLQYEIVRMQKTILEQKQTVANMEGVEQELIRVKQEIADSKRRDIKSDYEITKNLRRIRASEKKLLEAYMRLASYNLFSASENLKIIEKKRGSGVLAKDSWENNRKEARNMIGDYLNHLRSIIDDTQEDLFQEVKTELVAWLKENMVVETQVKSLDLIERHVRAMRKGKVLDAEQLETRLLSEPEMK